MNKYKRGWLRLGGALVIIFFLIGWMKSYAVEGGVPLAWLPGYMDEYVLSCASVTGLCLDVEQLRRDSVKRPWGGPYYRCREDESFKWTKQTIHEWFVGSWPVIVEWTDGDTEYCERVLSGAVAG